MGVFLLWLVILCVIIGSNLSREKKKKMWYALAEGWKFL